MFRFSYTLEAAFEVERVILVKCIVAVIDMERKCGDEDVEFVAALMWRRWVGRHRLDEHHTGLRLVICL